ncbi:3'-5' exonuclease [Acinetobacter baumannii]|nr:3'-5' exonuclease [Acinetobacter baumannii]
MNAIIFDTETNRLHGLPIQISYVPCSNEHGVINTQNEAFFNQFFSIDEPICYGSMAIHHIVESDLVNKPSYKTFRLPESVEYVIGHNVEYDIEALRRCGMPVDHLKPICTMALSKKVFPDAQSYKLGALIYMLSAHQTTTRKILKNAHDALVDVQLTADLLKALQQRLKAADFEYLHQMTVQACIPTVLSFGKYKGTPINDVDISYVLWLLKQDNIDKYLKIALQNRLDQGR